MMQQPAYGMPTQNTAGYPQQMYYDDFYMPQAAGRRLSRGSAGQQRAGSAMRVSKPVSANNSPRSAVMAARRRTMMNDSSNGNNVRRQQQFLDYLSTAQNMGAPMPSQGRPLSWHPSSHLMAPQANFQHTPNTNPLSTPNMYADYQDMYFGTGPQYSPMVESYSTNTSPASTFSPLPASFPPLENDQYFDAQNWEATQKPGAIYTPTEEGQMFPPLPPSMDRSQMQGSNNLDWNNFIMHGFNKTSPPTPETFLQAPQQQQVPLQEPAEEEGEILVGMGLYDTPDKHDADPQLNNYRSTVTSLLGSTFRPAEPVGKGLKLEETWEPPKSDDEDDEDDDGQDAEGEEEAAGSA